MLSPKGREEIERLLEGGLVHDWGEAETTLRNVTRMLLTTRPDLLRLYFSPEAWEQITAWPQKKAANAIIAALRTGVVDALGRPAIANREQARFYLLCFQDDLAERVDAWCREHPEECPRRSRARTQTLPGDSEP
ncbi:MULTISPECIES: hypothetical protein [unclassified Thioalkalivibrio]|uniref:hypothetical protein n=1 Tax=unclassified Thioalkalivibrio TaxID=2621013 RepID=UPI00037CFC65|nr:MULTISPECIES: hypothetical protein [unclassified Thioalkalivibrio]